MRDISLVEELRLGAVSDLITIRDRVYAGEIIGVDIIEIHAIIDNVNALAAIAEDFEGIQKVDKNTFI